MQILDPMLLLRVMPFGLVSQLAVDEREQPCIACCHFMPVLCVSVLLLAGSSLGCKLPATAH